MRIIALIMLWIGNVAGVSAGEVQLKTVEFDDLGQYWERTVNASEIDNEAVQRVLDTLELGETAHATVTFVINSSGEVGEWKVEQASHDGLLVPLLESQVSSYSFEPAAGLSEPVPVRVVMRDWFERY